MTHWNYRVVRHSPEQGEIYYGIHEAYYDDEDNVLFITESPVEVWGEDEDDLIKGYANMSKAFGKPVIDFDTREEI
jgi:hypothetical protein